MSTPASHPIHPAHAPSGQLQLNVFFQGVNSSTIWRAPEAGSQIAPESFAHVAKTAEKGLFSAFFLAEGLRLREHRGVPFELDVAGRPDNQTMLAALAAETERIGFVATQNTTFTDPVELARRLQSLDLLSGGRAAWNVVTTDNAWTGENFRRGGYLDHADRYTHAEAAVEIARAIWRGQDVEHHGQHYEVHAQGSLPRSAQGEPVIFQAGVSPAGRDFAVRVSDVIFTPFTQVDVASDFRRDIVERAVAQGRDPQSVLITPVAEFIIAETDAEAREKEQWVRENQFGPEQAIAWLEVIWGTDLSAVDPLGPLPASDPVGAADGGASRGTSVSSQAKSVQTAQAWREEAAEKGQNILEFARSKQNNAGAGFVGSYDSVADQLAEHARLGTVDGFNVTPYLVPQGLDEVVEQLVPRLQERGVYRTEYPGRTLRENLGLASQA